GLDLQVPVPHPREQQGPVLGPPGRSVAGREDQGPAGQRIADSARRQRERQRGRLHRASRVSDRLDHVRGYYAALDTGDADLIAAYFTDDAVHYYTRLGPHAGGRTIAVHAAGAYERLNGRCILEHAVEGDDEVVIEWTMTWRDPESGARRLDRGTEWFRIEDGLIAEVRPYHPAGRTKP